MIALLGRAILGWLSTNLGALFLSWRFFFTAAFMIILSVYLYNIMSGILGEVLTFASGKMASVAAPSGTGSSYTFVGFAGYMLSVLKIPQCMSFIVAALLFKFVMRKIPFIKW